jgi:ubiquinone/menaquinone biosynthesis C-methylase UbiE
MRAALLLALLPLAGCSRGDTGSDRPVSAREFPQPYRPVSTTKANEFSTEVQRDSVNEAQKVMDLADIREGTTVADIGAGEGYYTVRLAARVGKKGRVLAQDIDKGAIQRLGTRVERDRLDNVSIKLGAPDDPGLPGASFDRVFLIHMYHEVTEPYAFLWRLRPSLRPGGQVIVVDVDRPTGQHGIPPALLFCEFGAVGFRLARFELKPELQGYYAQFEVVGERPAPSAIKPCGKQSGAQARAKAAN